MEVCEKLTRWKNHAVLKLTPRKNTTHAQLGKVLSALKYFIFLGPRELFKGN